MVPHPHISIHAPREGATLVVELAQLARPQFQSTPPARGRLLVVLVGLLEPNFNPRPPRGGDLQHSFTY